MQPILTSRADFTQGRPTDTWPSTMAVCNRTNHCLPSSTQGPNPTYSPAEVFTVAARHPAVLCAALGCRETTAAVAAGHQRHSPPPVANMRQQATQASHTSTRKRPQVRRDGLAGSAARDQTLFPAETAASPGLDLSKCRI